MINTDQAKGIFFRLDKKGLVQEVQGLDDSVKKGDNFFDCFKLNHFSETETLLDLDSLKTSAILNVRSESLSLTVEHSFKVDGVSFVIHWHDVTSAFALVEKFYKKQYLDSVGKITHDFNNVLAVILGHAELAQMVDDVYRPKHIKSLLSSVEKTKSLLKQVLVFRHHLDDRAEAEFELHVLLRSAVADVREKISDKIKLELSLTEGLVIMESQQRIEEIFSNLLANAVESIEGSGEIIVSLEMFSQDFHLVRIEDTGTGMSPSTQSEIFTPFYSTRSRLDSAGVGLSLVKGILDNIGGRIEFDSELGQGTKVKVYIPAHLKE